MIDHLALFEINNLTDRFGLTNGVPKGVKPRYNLTPTQPTPVIIKNDGRIELKMMNWGLVSQGAKDLNSVFRYKTHNVQSEKVFSKASWDTAIRKQRCVIPVNGFYMIRNNDSSDVYFFTQPDGSLFGLAGFFTTWSTPDGIQTQTFTLLTIESNDAMPLPFGRMPVILHKEDEGQWIDPEITQFSTVGRTMRPYEAGKLDYRKVSKDVASAKIDAPSLVETLK